MFQDATFATQCSSTVTYSISVSPAEPTITYDSSNNKVLLTTSTPVLNAYSVTVTGTLATGETGVVIFNLIVANKCSSAVLTPPSPLTTYTVDPYIVGQPQMRYFTNPFTTTDSSCTATYSMTMADGTPLTPSLLSYQSSGLKLMVGQTTNNAFVGSYSVVVVATIAITPPLVFTSTPFTISVLHQCTYTKIISPTSTTFNYIIETLTLNPNTYDLAWSQNITSCPPITYELTTPLSYATNPSLVALNVTGAHAQVKFVIDAATAADAGTYTLDITARVWSTDGSIMYRDKVATYTFNFLSCANTVITTKSV